MTRSCANFSLSPGIDGKVDDEEVEVEVQQEIDVDDITGNDDVSDEREDEIDPADSLVNIDWYKLDSFFGI